MVNKCCMSIYFNLVLILWTFSPEKDILKLPMNGRGGSSSGSISGYWYRGPGFDSLWELGFSLFSFSSLSHLPISGASLFRFLVEVQYYCYFQRLSSTAWCEASLISTEWAIKGHERLWTNDFIAWVIFLLPRLPLPVNYFELNYLSFQRGLFELSTDK